MNLNKNKHHFGDYIIFAQIKTIFVVDHIFWLIQRKLSIEKLQLYLFSRSKISVTTSSGKLGRAEEQFTSKYLKRVTKRRKAFLRTMS